MYVQLLDNMYYQIESYNYGLDKYFCQKCMFPYVTKL